MAFFDFDHPFFEPAWRRALVVGLCLGWGAFEFATDAPMWGFAFAGAGAVAFYQMFLARRSRSRVRPEEER
jgi:hypothetical protein